MAKQRNLLSRPISKLIMFNQSTLDKLDEMANFEGVKRPDIIEDAIVTEHSRFTSRKNRAEKKKVQ